MSQHTSYTWNQENHWKSCFFNRILKWNCIWVTSEKIESGWGTGLQSVLNRPTKRLNRPTKRLEPASNRRSSRNHKGVCRDQLVHIRPPAPAPRKKYCFGGNLQFFLLLHPGNGHISKTRTKTQLVSFWTDMVKKVILKVLSKSI